VPVHQRGKSAYSKILSSSSPSAAGKEHGAEQLEVPVLGQKGKHKWSHQSKQLRLLNPQRFISAMLPVSRC